MFIKAGGRIIGIPYPIVVIRQSHGLRGRAVNYRYSLQLQIRFLAQESRTQDLWEEKFLNELFAEAFNVFW